MESRDAKYNMIEKVMNTITFQPDLLEYLYKNFYHYKKILVHFFIISHLKVST